MTRHLRIALASVIAMAASLSTTPSYAQSENQMIVQGYVRFMAYHEAGHLLMNQLQGINSATAAPEFNERAADDIASVLLVPDADDPEGKMELFGAARAWLRAGPRFSESDPHAPPTERAEQIICIIYGSDPEGFADLQDIIRPDWDCKARHDEMLEGIVSGFVSDSDEPGAQITVTYRNAPPALQPALNFLREGEILEDLSKDVSEFFKLTRPVKLIALSCDQVGAASGTFHYDPPQSSRPEDNYDQISICYEMINSWLKQDFENE